LAPARDWLPNKQDKVMVWKFRLQTINYSEKVQSRKIIMISKQDHASEIEIQEPYIRRTDCDEIAI
jgi:hypothetical protein